MKYSMTTQRQIRKRFWLEHPDFDFQCREAGILGKPQNEHCATLRCTFVDWIDSLQKGREISQALAERATL